MIAQLPFKALTVFNSLRMRMGKLWFRPLKLYLQSYKDVNFEDRVTIEYTTFNHDSSYFRLNNNSIMIASTKNLLIAIKYLKKYKPFTLQAFSLIVYNKVIWIQWSLRCNILTWFRKFNNKNKDKFKMPLTKILFCIDEKFLMYRIWHWQSRSKDSVFVH